MGVPVLEESGRGSVSRKLFSWRHAFFFAAGGLVFFLRVRWLSEHLSKEKNGKKREEKKEGENEFFERRCQRWLSTNRRKCQDEFPHKKKDKEGQKEKEGD